MAIEYGDIWPQASGVASLGAEMTNGGFVGDARPFAHVHMNSGVLHDPLMGQSGVIRYALGIQLNDTTGGGSILPGGKLNAFEFSTDGGTTFPIRIGSASGTITDAIPGVGQGFGLVEAGEGRALLLRGSGVYLFSQGNISFLTLQYDGGVNQLGDFNVTAYGSINLTNNSSAITTGFANVYIAARDNVNIQSSQNSLTFNATLGQAIFNLGDQFLLNVYKSSPVSPASGSLRYQFGAYEGWYWRGSNQIGFPLGNVLPSSGAVNQMIQGSRADIGSGLQKTYDASREATLLLPTSLVAPGLLLKLQNGSRNSLFTDVRGFVPTYGIAVSGFSSTQLNPHSYGISFLGHNSLSFQGSGTSQSNLWLGLYNTGAYMMSSGVLSIAASGMNIMSDSTDMNVDVLNGSFFVRTTGSTKQINLHSLDGGRLIVDAGGIGATLQVFSDGTAYYQSNETTDFSVGTALTFVAGTDISTSSSNGSVSTLSSKQISQSSFGGSGRLDYQFGPYQAWYTYSSNNGFAGFPIAHSGQVNQMIQASRTDIGSGLQNAYNAGDEITLASRPALVARGVLIKYPANVSQPRPEGNRGELHGYGMAVSGASTTPTNVNSYPILTLAPSCIEIQGSGTMDPQLWLGVDSQVNAARIHTSGVLLLNAASGVIMNSKLTLASSGTAPLNLSGVFIVPNAKITLGDMFMMHHSVISGMVSATNAATDAAQALGIGTLVLNTGSGIINVSVGSGIMQCINNGAQTITAALVDVNLNFITQSADQNYTLTTATGTSGVITVMSPGLYKISYKIAATKTIGSTPQFVETQMVVNNNGVAVLGSLIDSFHYDTTAAKASATTSILQNLDAGDNLRLQIKSSLDGANNCQIPNRGAIFIIEKIGPKRGTF